MAFPPVGSKTEDDLGHSELKNRDNKAMGKSVKQRLQQKQAVLRNRGTGTKPKVVNPKKIEARVKNEGKTIGLQHAVFLDGFQYMSSLRFQHNCP